jgi:hypothetical protein
MTSSLFATGTGDLFRAGSVMTHEVAAECPILALSTIANRLRTAVCKPKDQNTSTTRNHGCAWQRSGSTWLRKSSAPLSQKRNLKPKRSLENVAIGIVADLN